MDTQKLKFVSSDVYKKAEMYYFIISVINNFKLTKKDIQLISYTSIKGNISNFNSREEFCKIYKAHPGTINNIIFKLKKLGIIIKTRDRIHVNPLIILDFKKSIKIEINTYETQ